MVMVSALLNSLTLPVHALSPSGRMGGMVAKISEETTGVKSTGFELPSLVGQLLYAFISALGVVMTVYILYGGYLWMTARGDEKQVEKAQDMIKNAIIGMVVVALSFFISSYVLQRLGDVMGNGGGAPPAEAPAEAPSSPI